MKKNNPVNCCCCVFPFFGMCYIPEHLNTPVRTAHSCSLAAWLLKKVTKACLLKLFALFFTSFYGYEIWVDSQIFIQELEFSLQKWPALFCATVLSRLWGPNQGSRSASIQEVTHTSLKLLQTRC